MNLRHVLSLCCLVFLLRSPPTIDAAAVEPDLFTVSDHWTGLTGVVSVRLSPVSPHVFVLLRAGIVRVFDSFEATESRVLIDISDMVFNWRDHAATAFEVHPEFRHNPMHTFCLLLNLKHLGTISALVPIQMEDFVRNLQSPSPSPPPSPSPSLPLSRLQDTWETRAY